MASTPMDIPRRNPTQGAALAAVERGERAGPLLVSVAEHVAVKGGKVAAILVATGFVGAATG